MCLKCTQRYAMDTFQSSGIALCDEHGKNIENAELNCDKQSSDNFTSDQLPKPSDGDHDNNHGKTPSVKKYSNTFWSQVYVVLLVNLCK